MNYNGLPAGYDTWRTASPWDNERLGTVLIHAELYQALPGYDSQSPLKVTLTARELYYPSDEGEAAEEAPDLIDEEYENVYMYNVLKCEWVDE